LGGQMKPPSYTSSLMLLGYAKDSSLQVVMLV